MKERSYFRFKFFLNIVTQLTFLRCFNVVFRLIWRRDVAQRQINVETMLCTSTSEFTTLNNFESMLFISTLIWTTLDRVETTSFSTSIFSHMIKSTILIGQNYLFNYISQSNYYVIEIFNHPFKKKNIETKDGRKFC